MRRSRLAVLGLTFPSLLGCTDAGIGTPVQPDTSAIISGKLSDPSDDAVVFGQGGGNACTGALIAPDVVLTALHCVTNFDSRTSFSCQADGTLAPGSTNGQLGPVIDPALVSIAWGVQLGKGRIKAKTIYGTDSPEACRDDLAVIVLESAVPVGDVPLIALRFERTTKKQERTRIIGYGDTAGTSTENGRQERDDVVVLGVGGPNLSTPGDPGIAPRTIKTGEGSCKGDSGGPLFSEETGAEIGVYSLLDNNTCGGPDVTNTYTQVAPFESLIRMALSSVDEEPIVEPPEPASSGGEGGEPGTAGAFSEGGAAADPGGTGGSPPVAGSGTGAIGGAATGGSTGSAAAAGSTGVDPGESTGSGSRRDPSCTCRTAGTAANSAWAGAGLLVAITAAFRRRRRR
jgi:MYXO-CTERM domain-containing protein